MIEDKFRPWYPWDCPKAVVAAFQAMHNGAANDRQQKMLLDWLINKGLRTYDVPYYPDSERDSTFAAAKQFAGFQIVKQLKRKIGQMPDEPVKPPTEEDFTENG